MLEVKKADLKRKETLDPEQLEEVARTVASAITDIIVLSHSTILKNAEVIDKAKSAKDIDYNEIDSEEFSERLEELRDKYYGKLDFYKLYANMLTTTWGQDLMSSVIYDLEEVDE